GILVISFMFSIFGRGGGEFKLPLLLSMVALPFGELKTISVFLILVQGVIMLLIYSKKHHLMDWPFAILLAGFVAISSFFGAYFSHTVQPFYLKGLFVLVLLVSALKMAMGVKQSAQRGRFGVWERPGLSGHDAYFVNLIYLLPPLVAIAFIAGMLGVSGCGLIIPLTIIVGGLPIRIAIGSNTLLLITSTGASFSGHLMRHTFHYKLALILAAATAVGAYFGSRQHTDISEQNIKRGFITILLIAALWMAVKMFW
ncbi:sulfite exporter TauE/SafE family protein, partial [Myxococcota bacterium]|nr:sulfite exporter TauE/SafE family protein [Myxococcota bacterium]